MIGFPRDTENLCSNLGITGCSGKKRYIAITNASFLTKREQHFRTQSWEELSFYKNYKLKGATNGHPNLNIKSQPW